MLQHPPTRTLREGASFDAPIRATGHVLRLSCSREVEVLEVRFGSKVTTDKAQERNGALWIPETVERRR